MRHVYRAWCVGRAQSKDAAPVMLQSVTTTMNIIVASALIPGALHIFT